MLRPLQPAHPRARIPHDLHLEQPLLSATREKACLATKALHSQKQMKKIIKKKKKKHPHCCSHNPLLTGQSFRRNKPFSFRHQTANNSESPWLFKSSNAIVKQSRVSAGYSSGLRAWGRIGKDSIQPVFIDPLQIKASWCSFYKLCWEPVFQAPCKDQ